MRRWHTRDAYRRRALAVAARMPGLGRGADVITGFPGETAQDHADTRALIDELPFTYLHVFPFSPRDGTAAAELHAQGPVPARVAGERARELRELAVAKGSAYRARRTGAEAEVTLEARGTAALTGDYLRVGVSGAPAEAPPRLHRGTLRGAPTGDGADLYIDLTPSVARNSSPVLA
jgi:threonylcarbamoyladenosine tRNA methylthiotransferase MtaB